MAADYAELTEQPGGEVTPEALRMVQTRYHLAARLARGRDVCELGGGSGMGYSWIAREAKSFIGTDITPRLVARSRETTRGRVAVAVVDATRLPFRDARFDLLLLFEAIYYLPSASAFLDECRRVLRPGGLLLVCSASRRRPGFVQSPRSTAYFDAEELRRLFADHGFTVDIQGAFAAAPPGAKARVLTAGLGVANKLRLVPRTLEGRARLKRWLHSDMVPLPDQVNPEDGEPEQLQTVESGGGEGWKVLYATGVRS